MNAFRLHPQLAADTQHLAALALCEVLLMNDSNHPWLILVPRITDASELLDLDEPDRVQLWREIDLASRTLRELFTPDKLNIAALGNVVSQLHIHVIARFRDDPAWPKPVWGTVAPRPYSPDELERRIERLRTALA